MKHWTQFLTVAALGMFLVACGGDKSSKEKSASEESPKAEGQIPADWVGIYSIDSAESCNGASVTLNITASSISFLSSSYSCKHTVDKLTKVTADGDSLVVEHDYFAGSTETFTRVGDKLLVSTSRPSGASGTFKKGLPAEGAGQGKGDAKKTEEAAGAAKAEAAAGPSLKYLRYGDKVSVPADLLGRWKKKKDTGAGASDKGIMTITQRSVVVTNCWNYGSKCNVRLPINKVERDAPLFTVHHGPSANGNVEAGTFTVMHEPLGFKFAISDHDYWGGTWRREKNAFTSLSQSDAEKDEPPTENLDPGFFKEGVEDGKVAEIPKHLRGSWLKVKNTGAGASDKGKMTITKSKIMVSNCWNYGSQCNVTVTAKEIFVDNPLVSMALSESGDAEETTITIDQEGTSVHFTLLISDHPFWQGSWIKD